MERPLDFDEYTSIGSAILGKFRKETSIYFFSFLRHIFFSFFRSFGFDSTAILGKFRRETLVFLFTKR